LITNVPHEELDRPLGHAIEEQVVKKCGNAVEYTRGVEMGGFKLGSTVVLVFEARKEFEFLVKSGETVQMGQPLGK
jgi:phosphatidylserine decarboxylase